MKPELTTRIQTYLNRKRPQPKVTHHVKKEAEPVDEYEQAKYELSEAWKDWKEVCKWPILILKLVLFAVFAVSFLWALAVVDIQIDCYNHKECREWMR